MEQKYLFAAYNRRFYTDFISTNITIQRKELNTVPPHTQAEYINIVV